ncbi:hypothetical protein ACKUV4_015390 [Acinetobacter baumannii]
MADGGQVEIAYSDQATLVDGTTVHNLWQENKFAIRAERFVSWLNAVRLLQASFNTLNCLNLLIKNSP